MKRKLLFATIILLVNSMAFSYAQENTVMKTINEPYIFGVPETYDFLRTENGTKGVIYEQNRWVIEIWKRNKNGNGTCYAYAPATDFYKIIKYYYPNGMIQKRGKTTAGVAFGQWEYFDEDGRLIKVEDKDDKFKGLKVTREDVIAILEKEGWINRKTGVHMVVDDMTARRHDLSNPLRTDGSFYRFLQPYIEFSFNSAVVEKGKEVTPPVWFATIYTYKMSTRYTTTYKIDARSGKYEVYQSSAIITH